MAGSGSVGWIFTPKGYILLDKSQGSEDDIFSISVDAGAEDVKTTATNYEIFCDPKDLDKVKQALISKNIKCESAEITQIPSNSVKLGAQEGKQVLSLIEALEDQDDVQKVHANFDIPDDIMEKIAQEIE